METPSRTTRQPVRRSARIQKSQSPGLAKDDASARGLQTASNPAEGRPDVQIKQSHAYGAPDVLEEEPSDEDMRETPAPEPQPKPAPERQARRSAKSRSAGLEPASESESSPEVRRPRAPLNWYRRAVGSEPPLGMAGPSNWQEPVDPPSPASAEPLPAPLPLTQDPTVQRTLRPASEALLHPPRDGIFTRLVSFVRRVFHTEDLASDEVRDAADDGREEQAAVGGDVMDTAHQWMGAANDWGHQFMDRFPTLSSLLGFFVLFVLLWASVSPQGHISATKNEVMDMLHEQLDRLPGLPGLPSLPSFGSFHIPFSSSPSSPPSSSGPSIPTIVENLGSLSSLIKSANQRIDLLESHSGAADSVFKRLKGRVDSLESSLKNLQATTGYRAQQVNFFTPQSGALVDPHLTSKTKELGNPNSPGLWFARTTTMFPLKKAPSPVTALMPWQDAGDCWCAEDAKDPNGMAHIGILTAKKIYPTELVVEHIPREATLDPGATPRDLEVWVHIEDDNIREHVANAAFTYLKDPSRPSMRMHENPRVNAQFVRVAQLEYDVYGSDHVQTFSLPIRLERYKAAINRVVVQVVNNWGDNTDHVCLYRMKMHGSLAEGEKPKSTLKAGW